MQLPVRRAVNVTGAVCHTGNGCPLSALAGGTIGLGVAI